MKKITILSLLLLSVIGVKADKYMNIIPLFTTANDPVATTTNKITFTIPDDYANYQGLQFDLYIPEGIEIDPDYPEKGAGLPYTTDRGGNKTYKHTLELNALTTDKEGYKKYKVLLYNTTNTYFTDSEIFSLYCGTTAEASGIYTIIIKDLNLAKNGTSSDLSDYVSSFVQVGNTQGIFNPIGILPSTATSVIPANSIVNFSNVTAIYGTCLNTVNGTYEREVSGTYASLFLPFDALVSGATAYEYKSKDDTNVYFTKVTSLKKNTAYLLKMDGTSFTATGASTLATAASTGTGFVGTCEPIKITTESGYGLSGDKFQPIAPYVSETEGTVIPAFRAYLNTGTSEAKSDLNIVFDDEATGITTADLSVADDDIVYGINGVRVKAKSAHNGVYITKGKKVVVK